MMDWSDIRDRFIKLRERLQELMWELLEKIF